MSQSELHFMGSYSDSDTYLHRVARAGRFGTKGLAISFIADDEDEKIQRR